MTGTAMTEANEFWKVYKLDVVAIPTNRPAASASTSRTSSSGPSRRSTTRSSTRSARSTRPAGRSWSAPPRSRSPSSSPRCSSGTASSTRSSTPSTTSSEAEIVAQAGRKGVVTIATNMAGRGTDIILGGNPEFMAWADLSRSKDEDGRPLYPTRLEVPPEVWKEAVDKYEPEMKAEGREVAGARRPAHHRHRAPRVPPDRQPAPRPIRPPGRPRAARGSSCRSKTT